MKKYLYIFLALVIASCAQIKNPTGGQKDVLGPKIIESFPKHLQTNYKGKSVAISFDELVSLTDPNNNIVITPPLNNKPEIYLKSGKTLIIEFNDTLLQNTTYTLNLGDAISDYTENNPLDSSLVVFSTGSFIDSLSFSGTVTHIERDEKCVDCKVMLYNNFEDSTVFKDRPFYFAKTNDKGEYNFDYLKAGDYEIIGLQDMSNNFVFDPDEDEIGFINESINPVNISEDSLIFLNIFKEIPSTQQLASFKLNSDQNLVLNFNLPVEKLIIEKDSIDVTNTEFISIYNEKKDSVSLWIKNPPEKNTEWKLNIKDGENELEKISIFFNENLLGCNFISPKTGDVSKIQSSDSLILTLSTPIKTVDESMVQVTTDTTFKNFEINKLDDFHLQLIFEKQANKLYVLKVDSSAVIDIYGQASDSLRHRYIPQEDTFFGNLQVTLDPSKTKRIGFLKNEKGSLERTQEVDGNGVLTFKNLNPGNYNLMILFDENEDGNWTTGNYLNRIHAEKFIRFQGEINIRSNWSLELE